MGSDRIFDIAVIGGGINGAGIAADAAGRGLSVCLIEQGDLAGATSSASSKLIHGGLRYLEQYEFALVRDALSEREHLLTAAPHIITPLRFVLPHVDGMRPRWLLRAGLFLYDHLAKRQTLPGSRSVRFATDPSGRHLRADITRGFCYWDCWVDDARLVVLNARAAAQKGAAVHTRTRVTSYQPDPVDQNLWQIQTASENSSPTIKARALVNAAGPWSDQVAAMEQDRAGVPRLKSAGKLRLVKGSHVVVPRTPGMDDGYLLQSSDGRVVFALPFEQRFTLIGTTDEPFDGDPADVACDNEERDYLLRVCNRFFGRRLTPEDVVHQFSGVRPLFDDAEQDPSKVTRDYRLEFRARSDSPPVLTVLGGKITTYRKLAEDAVNRFAAQFSKAGAAWTADHPLPGGALHEGVDGLKERLVAKYPNLCETLLSGLADRHGSLAFEVLGDAHSVSDLGGEFVPGLTKREVLYLRDFEWAKTAEDVLWRRTKFGLHVAPGEKNTLEAAVAACLAH